MATKRKAGVSKGSKQRPTNKQAFDDNYDIIFNKKAMDQFEVRTHKRLIDIIEPTAATVDELKKLNLPAGVDISINV